MDAWFASLLAALALPQYGLSSLFVVAFVSATLLPLGSEPALLGLVELNPSLFWPAIGVATLGNTLGGMVSWWMGYAGHQTLDRLTHKAHHIRALQWIERFGPKACLLGWLPLVGDPLCALAGWAKLPALPCMVYMAIGKLARYVVLTVVLGQGLQWMGLAHWAA
jgi:membrane protein YqaA with SNARE-associated domain